MPVLQADERSPIQEHLFSHVNTAVINYCWYNGAPNWAERYDFLIGTHPEYMEELVNLNPNAINLFYFLPETIMQTNAGELAQAEAFAEANDFDVEDLFLHYRDNTTVTLQNEETITIPGCGDTPTAASRVQGYVWTSKRYMYNVCNPWYPQFLAEKIVTKLDTPIPGTTDIFYNGIMGDEMPVRGEKWPDAWQDEGGDIFELDGLPTQERVQYRDAAPAMFEHLKAQMGNRILMLNTAQYARFDYAIAQENAGDGALLELWLCPITHLGEEHFDFVNAESELEKIMILLNNSGVFWGIDRFDNGMFTLAAYYMVRSPYSYVAWSPDGYGDYTNAWFEAMEYDIGDPQEQYYVFDTVQQTFIHSQTGNPTQYTVKVFGRHFDNALVLVKPNPHWSVDAIPGNYDENSSTTHDLPVTPDNPTGEYYQLYADGSMDGYPVVNVDLKLGRGAILIKASSLESQPDTAAPYITNLNPADGQTNVPVDTNISLNIIDDGAGVDLGAGEMIITANGQNVTGSLSVSGSPADYAVVFDPDEDFGYEETVTVEISAFDLADPPNYMQYTYSFTTEEPLEHPPNTPSNPYPTDGATGIPIIDTILSWIGGDPDPGDTVTYDLYFGNTTSPELLVGNITEFTLDKLRSNTSDHHRTESSYALDELNYNTTYYWNIEAWDNHGSSTQGPEWNFMTGINNHHLSRR